MKLEIPISIEDQIPNKQAKQFNQLTVCTQQSNSNVQLEYLYDFNNTALIVSLQGPSEAKFGSKQDYSKAFIEVVVRGGANVPKELRADLKNLLEQIIQTN